MTPRSLVRAFYESSVLSSAGVPLLDGWKAIATAHGEPEVISLFDALSKDWESGNPSTLPFSSGAELAEDMPFITVCVSIAAATTMYEQCWSDMAIGLLLKKKLMDGAPSEQDLALGTYLLSLYGTATDPSVREALLSWSSDPLWKQIPAREEVTTFPEKWWESFSGGKDTVFPPTISRILVECLAAGSLESVIPDVARRWTMFSTASERVFEDGKD